MRLKKINNDTKQPYKGKNALERFNQSNKSIRRFARNNNSEL